MKKRILSILIALSLLLCMAPAVSGAPMPAFKGLTEEQEHYQEGCPSARFQDVPAFSDWAHEGIDYCVGTGLMNGISDSVFNPNGTVSRAQLVTILYRVEGEPTVPSWYSSWFSYSDVPNNLWYSDSVTWASYNSIVNGVGGGRFNPDGPVTREQIATILYRFVGSPYVYSSLSSFPDAQNVSYWAREAMEWANAATGRCISWPHTISRSRT